MKKLKRVHIQITKELEDGINWLINECGYTGKTSVICESVRETIEKHRKLKALESNPNTKAFDLKELINKIVDKKLEKLKAKEVIENKPNIKKTDGSKPFNLEKQKGKPFNFNSI